MLRTAEEPFFRRIRAINPPLRRPSVRLSRNDRRLLPLLPVLSLSAAAAAAAADDLAFTWAEATVFRLLPRPASSPPPAPPGPSPSLHRPSSPLHRRTSSLPPSPSAAFLFLPSTNLATFNLSVSGSCGLFLKHRERREDDKLYTTKLILRDRPVARPLRGCTSY